MKRIVWILVCASSAFADRAHQCSDMTSHKLPGLALEITKAEWKPAGTATGVELPPHCRLDGVLDRRTGVGGKTYGIQFAVALPDTWNGRFLMQGGAALNGRVRPPLGNYASGERPALAHGYAVATTDTGHQGGSWDASFMADQQAALDFAYVAVGRVAEMAKQVIASYYGQAPRYSYFAGCSTGGREGMLMTQRYPTYFNGVVVGAPAIRTGYSNLAVRYVATLLNQIAPKDEAGKPITERALSNANKKFLIDSLLKTCDEKDGLRDGMIWNTAACDFDPESLVCTEKSNGSCLTAAQASAISKGFSGPKNSRGEPVYAAFP